MAYDRVAGDRVAAGVRPCTSMAYHEFTRPNGSKFHLDASHGIVWYSLMLHAVSLSESPAHVLHSRDKIAQFAHITVDVLDPILKDLIQVGLVFRKRRTGPRTNQIFFFMEPYDPVMEPSLETHPLQFTGEPPYVPHKAYTPLDGGAGYLPPAAEMMFHGAPELEVYLQTIQSYHLDTQDPQALIQTVRALLPSISLANGSVEYVVDILNSSLEDLFPKGESIRKGLGPPSTWPPT